MEEREKIVIALMAIDKKMDCDTLRYCDDLYGREEFTDDVWEYVEECEQIGTTAFREKYNDLI